MAMRMYFTGMLALIFIASSCNQQHETALKTDTKIVEEVHPSVAHDVGSYELLIRSPLKLHLFASNTAAANPLGVSDRSCFVLADLPPR